MQEGILAVSHIHESRIQSRHDLLHLPQVDIPHAELVIGFFLVQFDEELIFKQGNFNPLGSRIDN